MSVRNNLWFRVLQLHGVSGSGIAEQRVLVARSARHGTTCTRHLTASKKRFQVLPSCWLQGCTRRVWGLGFRLQGLDLGGGVWAFMMFGSSGLQFRVYSGHSAPDCRKPKLGAKRCTWLFDSRGEGCEKTTVFLCEMLVAIVEI